MKAAICTKYGPPETVIIEEIQKPVPKDDEILVRVHATTIASGDCRVRGANVAAIYRPMLYLIYGVGKPKQPILGTELAGQVEAVGKKVTTFKMGDSVFAMTGMKMGAHAEYITMSEKDMVVSKPDNISYEQAAAIAFGGTTALSFFRKGNLQKGQKILIYGASGAVGTSAVQLARYLGAEVTGVCSGKNMELVKSLGACKVIDYTVEDFRNNGEKYDIIFDAVGKITKGSCKNSLANTGKYLTVNGGPARVRITDLLLLGELAQNGTYAPIVDRIYPFEQIVEAYIYAESEHKKGNVVITIQESQSDKGDKR